MLHLTTVYLKREKIKTLLVPVCEDKPLHKNPALVALIEQALKLKEFKGKKDQEVVFYNPPEVAAERVMLRGLGKAQALDAEALRQMVGKALKRCIKMDVARLWVAVPEAKVVGLEMPVLLKALLEAAYLGNHVFNRYKQEKEPKPLARIELIVDRATQQEYDRLPAEVEAVCRGTVLAREWVNTPPNEKPPVEFARLIADTARKAGLSVKMLNEAELRRRKFGALLAVAAGSKNRPAMLVLEHKPRGKGAPLVLVGKGITFDSGGLNLKTGPSLADMKCDMAGAAAVAAVMLTAAALKLERRIVGVLPLVENMISGGATRPGDIVTSFSGKSVEIGNTDAEGRLILADALAFAAKTYKPEVMVDLATLTGACVVALGERIAGVFANDEALQQEILAAGGRTFERCWPMPLPADYKELLKSHFADINNMPSAREGGAISAALFLSEFVGDTRWAHIDIAGPAYHKKENAYCGPGGTGFGVRLIMDWLTAA